jgi:hypothetical protein
MMNRQAELCDRATCVLAQLAQEFHDAGLALNDRSFLAWYRTLERNAELMRMRRDRELEIERNGRAAAEDAEGIVRLIQPAA